jgi:hypothetical protein
MYKTKKSGFSELKRIVSEKKTNSFKMVAFDMDGTLLNPSYQLSARTIASVKMIADAGLIVLLATGRITSAVKNHLEKLGTSGLVVSHNGALVKDVRTGKIYHHETIAKNVVKMLLERLYQKGEKTIVHFNFDDIVFLTVSNPYSEHYSQDFEVSLTYTSSFQELKGEPTSILLMDCKDVLENVLTVLSNELKKEFDYVMMPWQKDVWWLHLLPANTSKGKGVLQTAKRLGVQPEEIISFGDSYNDMDMLQHTGLAIAMGNAVPELKQVASFVTASNQEDGVALALEVILGL